MEDTTELVHTDLPIAVLVEHVESNFEVLFTEESSPVDCRSYELAVVDLIVVISVQLVDQVVPVL